MTGESTQDTRIAVDAAQQTSPVAGTAGVRPTPLRPGPPQLRTAAAPSAPDLTVSTAQRPRRPETPVARPVTRPTVVAVTGIGGGAGRTTVTAALGLTFAAIETCRVAAVDATPLPVGMLRSRIGSREAPTVHQYVAGARLPTQDPHAEEGDRSLRLQLLAGERPQGCRSTGPVTLAAALVRLKDECPLMVLDCPPSPEETSWPWVHGRAAAVVMVVRYTAADIRLLAETLNVLQRLEMRTLATRVVVVVNHTLPRAPGRSARLAASQLGVRVRTVRHLPFDQQLAAGQPIALARLARSTKAALTGIALECASRFR